jgi:hypothetical protein
MLLSAAIYNHYGYTLELVVAFSTA